MRDTRRMLREIQLIRKQAQRGQYNKAIALARSFAEQEANQALLAEASDSSNEEPSNLANAAR
jgi:hypothetical protein